MLRNNPQSPGTGLILWKDAIWLSVGVASPCERGDEPSGSIRCGEIIY